MSIKVMTMVFDRYPEGGNERLLALAMADHARDDGTRIWPSVAELARKTMQSERTVQRQIAKMVSRGWLEVVRSATGRPGDTNEYRVCPAWVAGGELPTGDRLTPVSGVATGDKLTPVSTPSTGVNLSPVCASQPVDNVIHTGDKTGETGDTADETGDIAVSPESSRTIKNHIPPLPPVETGGTVDKAKPGPLQSPPPRRAWRWADSREEVERRGEELGLGRYDALGFGLAHRELFAGYQSRVLSAHLWSLGYAITPEKLSGVLGGQHGSTSGLLNALVRGEGMA